MGCDIHGVLQREWGDARGWETVDQIDEDRSYAVFAALAGVRNYEDLKPIAEPRGLPDDFKLDDDEHVFEDMEGNLRRVWIGDHSYSWLSIDELNAWPEKERLGDQWLSWLRWVTLKHEPCKLRIVFGFDN